MARYLFGKVIVRGAIIEAESDGEANEILKDTTTEFGNRKLKFEHELYWGETPKSNIVHERDGVLAEFLKLMQDEIPRGSGKGLIIHPFKEDSNAG